MGEDGPGPQHAELVEIRSRALAMRLQAILHLPFGLGKMDLDGDLPLGRNLRKPTERLGAHRVDRMWPDARLYARSRGPELVEDLDLLGLELLALRRIELVDDHVADDRADSSVTDRRRDLS